jgi:hypothetical protein
MQSSLHSKLKTVLTNSNFDRGFDFDSDTDLNVDSDSVRLTLVLKLTPNSDPYSNTNCNP